MIQKKNNKQVPLTEKEVQELRDKAKAYSKATGKHLEKGTFKL